MRVVPRGSELGQKECVSSAVARGNRAFSNTADTITADAVELSDTVPVKTSAVVGEGILDVHDQSVTPVSKDSGSRVLTVDKITLHESVSIGTAGCIGDLKVVSNGVSSDRVLQVKIRLDTVAIAPASTRVRSIGTGSISNQ